MISTAILSVLFGFAAGVVGMLLVVVYFPSPYPSAYLYEDLMLDRLVKQAPIQALVPLSVESAARTSVLFFRKHGPGTGPESGTYVPSSAVGSGMVLTSDGWIISHESVFSESALSSLGGYLAIADSRHFDIQEAIHDTFTGIVFLKVDESNLPVTSFGSGGGLEAGESVFMFDVEGGPRRFDVISYGDIPVSDGGELVQSSERMQKVLRLSGIGDGIPEGSMVVNSRGEVIAIFGGPAAVGYYSVPLGHFSRHIGDVLKEKRFSRPYLGVHYIDLSRLIGIDDFGPRPRGALVADPAGVAPAVQRRSPAYDAGLREGDIILSVNEEDISSNKAFSDLLAEYEPGTAVILKIRDSLGRRGGIDLEYPIEVTLGTVP